MKVLMTLLFLLVITWLNFDIFCDEIIDLLTYKLRIPGKMHPRMCNAGRGRRGNGFTFNTVAMAGRTGRLFQLKCRKRPTN